ncbi:MAG TPA: hypothetical protein VJB90_01330, partial [Candidatus Nanoarchaeia archaeon]|nr:hypothetical protein [Candidatus Nanoarchaeia archaeon]
GLSQTASNISGLNATIGNLQTADGVITANITNLNASLQIAFTNIGTLVFNLSQTNSTVYTFMPLITQNLSNLNASFQAIYTALISNVTALNTTTANILSNDCSAGQAVQGYNNDGTPICIAPTADLSAITINVSNINASLNTLSQTASNISGLNSTIATLQTGQGGLTANLTAVNSTITPSIYLTTNVNVTSATSYEPIFTIPMVASKMNIIRVTLIQNSTGTATGIQNRARIDTDGQIGSCLFEQTTAATTGTVDVIAVSTNPADTADSAATLIATPYPNKVLCTIITTSTPGNLVIEFVSETAGINVGAVPGSSYTLNTYP